MNKLNTYLLPVLMVGAMACTPKAETVNHQQIADEAMKTNKEVSIEECDAVVSAAEYFLVADSDIKKTDLLLGKVLKTSPHHPKANLLKAFTQPLMAMKGIVDRMGKAPFWSAELKELRTRLEKETPSMFSELLLTEDHGKSKIRTEAELQEFLSKELLPEFKTALGRLETARASDKEIVITLRGRDRKRVLRVDAPAIEATQGIYRVVLDGLRVATAYDLTGMGRLREYVTHGKRKSTKKVFSKAMEIKDFLVLRSDHELDQLAGSMEEAIKAAMNLSEMKEILCNAEERAEHLWGAVCFGEGFVEGLAEAMQAVHGPIDIDMGEEYGMVRMDLLTFLSRPQRDLKAYLSENTTWTTDGRVDKFKDMTLNGLFPANEKGVKPEAVEALLKKLLAAID